MVLLTVAQARALDLSARERLGLSETELIERAGREAALVAARYGPLQGRRVLVLCGKGHNGADGLVAARHLRADGVLADAVLAFDEAELAAETGRALKEARNAGLRVLPLAEAAGAMQASALLIDALVGTGSRLPLTGNLADLVRLANASRVPVLALDIASGLDADSGHCGPVCIQARATLAFLAPKLGQRLWPGRAVSGELLTAALGVPEYFLTALDGPLALAFDGAQVLGILPPRDPAMHKKKAEVLLIAGSREYLGAALLCARGAYRCGAGLVKLALPEALAPFAMAALPEAVVVGFSADGALSDIHLEALLALAADANAVVVGPGLGRRTGTLALVQELWRRLPMPAVFDADALASLDVDDAPGGERVLTPHEGELKGLQGPQALQAGRVAAVRALARRSGAVTLLKGPATLVAQPDGGLTVNGSGNASLATAGSGDVLSGAIAALLAQGANGLDAAALGAWAHGEAAEAWCEDNADRGLLASDLADLLPRALASAGASETSSFT